MTIDEYFETGPAFERAIFEAIHAHMVTVDADIWFEPLSVGFYFKRRTTFLSLRTMTKWVAVGFSLERKLDHPRLARKVIAHGSRFHHVVNVRSADQVDDPLCEWLTEAWVADE